MSLTTITIDVIDYISYATLAEANAYLNVDPVREAAWEALADDEAREKKLIAATRRLDLLSWQGEKTGGASQENKWPRTGVSFPDGTAVSTTDVPKEVENATILLAGSITLAADVADAGTSGRDIQRVKAGSTDLTFFGRGPGVQLQDETAFKLVKIFLQSAVAGGSIGPLASGTDGESTFTDVDSFGRTRGFP